MQLKKKSIKGNRRENMYKSTRNSGWIHQVPKDKDVNEKLAKIDKEDATLSLPMLKGKVWEFIGKKNSKYPFGNYISYANLFSRFRAFIVEVEEIKTSRSTQEEALENIKWK